MMQVRECHTGAAMIECIKYMVKENSNGYSNPEFTTSKDEIIVTCDIGNRRMAVKFDFFESDDDLIDSINLETIINFPFRFNGDMLEEAKTFADSIAKEFLNCSGNVEYDIEEARLYIRSSVPSAVFALANLDMGIRSLIWDTKNTIAQLGVDDIDGISYCY